MGEAADGLHAELADHAAASRHHPPQNPGLSGRRDSQVLNAAYLLDEDQIEDLGLALMRLEEAMTRLKDHFDLDDHDLNLDLGPLGPLLPDD